MKLVPARIKAVAVALMAMPAIASPAAGARTLVQEITIDAPVADVWRAFTVEEEVVTWMCALAEIDFRVGGHFKTNYNPNGEIGDATTIVNEILSFEPERMLSMRNVEAPAGFEWTERFQQTWSVVSFEPLSPTRTHIRIAGLGYGEGEEWDQLYQFFEQGNAYILGELKKRLEAEANGSTERITDADTILERLATLAGGEWIHESETPDGGVFRARNVVRKGADGVTLVGHGFLGDASGMFDHGWTLMYRDPFTRRARFLNVNERGAVAQGDLALEGDTVHWDWRTKELSGDANHFHVAMTLAPETPDVYDFRLSAVGAGGSLTTLVDIAFERVDEPPRGFKRLRSAD